MNRYVIALLLFSLSVFGCGLNGPERASVEGEVTLGGNRLEKGSILFRPTEGTNGPTAGGTIENGKYSIPKENGPMVGTNRIEINAFQATGRKVPKVIGNPQAGLMDEVIEIIPQKYNIDSTLVREIESSANNLDFQL